MEVTPSVVIFTKVILPKTGPRRDITHVSRAVTFICDNYWRRIQTREVAAAAGVAPDYLSKVFKRRVGITTLAFIRRVRTQAALAMIENSPASLSQVATSVGFADQSHLTAAFKKQYKVTPASFRRRVKRR